MYKFTDITASMINDRIQIELSPSDLERYYQIMKSKAEMSNDYSDQKGFHRITDLLETYFNNYKKARKEYDNKNNGS